MIDFRSDTVTRPSIKMRNAMSQAEVGDDVYGDDPTVHELQQWSAKRPGFEAAIFCSSGTQANLLALTFLFALLFLFSLCSSSHGR